MRNSGLLLVSAPWKNANESALVDCYTNIIFYYCGLLTILCNYRI